MKINILAFGIVKDIFGQAAIDIELPQNATVATLKQLLEDQHPRLKKLSTYMIALNSEYAQDNDVIHDRDEIAVIPPVSGG